MPSRRASNPFGGAASFSGLSALPFGGSSAAAGAVKQTSATQVNMRPPIAHPPQEIPW
jgi:hypothetical protein